MKPVSVVIVTHNGLESTKRCLRALNSQAGHTNYDLVIADNASTDGTPEYLRSLGSVTLIETGADLGLAKAANRAVSQIRIDRDLVLLSSYAEVQQADWLERLQNSAYARSDLGLVGCRLRNERGVLQHAGELIPAQGDARHQFGSGEREINQLNADSLVDSVDFACVYIKREVLNKVGLLNETLVGGFESADYCLRALESGYSTVCCGKVTMVVHESVPAATMPMSRNGIANLHDRLTSKRYTRHLGWHSLFEFPSGYAISSKKIALALDRLRVELSYRYLYGPGTFFPIPEPLTSPEHPIRAIRERELGREGVQVVYGQGDRFDANFGRYRVGFTMLETTRIPSEWVRQANQMDEIWVPSQFNIRTFQESGVNRPIYAVPLGVDTNYFNPEIVGHPIPGVYSFLSIFEWSERKAPELLLKAFNDEFRQQEPVILICKILDNDLGANLSGLVRELRLQRSGGRIVFSVNEIFPTYQLGVLYRSADCFVLASRGEGWGMPIIEAMASGLPVIATNWSAQCDFMHEDNAYPVEVEKLIPAEARSPYYRGSEWAQPSYEHLRKQMRYVFENQQEARAMGARAASEVQSKWTWGDSAERIIARLDAVK